MHICMYDDNDDDVAHRHHRLPLIAMYGAGSHNPLYDVTKVLLNDSATIPRARNAGESNLCKNGNCASATQSHSHMHVIICI